MKGIAKYELYEFNGLTYIRRNTFPRFYGLVTMGADGMIDEVVKVDECPDVIKWQNAIKKGGEYLRKGRRL
jgi:hypothetical protein